jgi:hypothetical protein
MRREIRRLGESFSASLATAASRAGGQSAYPEYLGRPNDYARDVLGVHLTPEIASALEALHRPPCRVSIDSGHGVGKTFGAAVAVNWWYDTRDRCWIITTAPTERDVIDLLWTEVRLQRRRAAKPVPLDLKPAAPEMGSTESEHFARATPRGTPTPHRAGTGRTCCSSLTRRRASLRRSGTGPSRCTGPAPGTPGW